MCSIPKFLLCSSEILNQALRFDSNRGRSQRRDSRRRSRREQKDIKNALEAAESMGLTLPLTEAVQEMISALVARGKGDDDHGGIIQEIENRNNYEIRESL